MYVFVLWSDFKYWFRISFLLGIKMPENEVWSVCVCRSLCRGEIPSTGLRNPSSLEEEYRKARFGVCACVYLRVVVRLQVLV